MDYKSKYLKYKKKYITLCNIQSNKLIYNKIGGSNFNILSSAHQENKQELMQPIIISWIRHAETCNVLFENFAEDEYQYASDIDNNIILLDYQRFRKELLKIEENEYSKCTYDGETPFIELIGLKIKELNTAWTNNYKTSLLSSWLEKKEKTKDVYTKLFQKQFCYFPKLDKLVKNKKCDDALRMIVYDHGNQYNREEKINKNENPVKMPASWMLTPTLSYVGVIQSMELGLKLAMGIIKSGDINNYVFLSSASVRTIMTSIIALITSYVYLVSKTKKTIHIVPYISENLNGGDLIQSDISNSPIPIPILKNVLKLIFDWLNSKSFIDIFNSKFIELVKSFGINIDYNPNLLVHGFNVNSYVDVNIEIYSKNYSESQIKGQNEKVEDLLNNILNTNFNNNRFFYAFTHANFINDRRLAINNRSDKFNPFPNNCSIWTEEWVKLKNDNKTYIQTSITDYNKTYDKHIDTTPIGDRGSLVRNGMKVTPSDEINNLLTNNFSSLVEGKLRGDINRLWIKHLGWNVPPLPPSSVAIASYNMSYMSDYALPPEKRKQASEAAFLARLTEPNKYHIYWDNAQKLLETFLNKQIGKNMPCIIGLQEMNMKDEEGLRGELKKERHPVEVGRKLSCEIIDNMLVDINKTNKVNYIQVCNQVVKEIKKENVIIATDLVGTSIIFDTNFFGNVKHTQVYDNIKGSGSSGRPTLFVFTDKGYMHINTHGAQDKLTSFKDDILKVKTQFNEKSIQNRDNIKELTLKFLNDFKIKDTIQNIFITGDFNDRFDAITDITINDGIKDRKLFYNGKAPQSCCYNWDSSCFDDRYIDLGDGYGTCSHKPENKGTDMRDEGAKNNYRYRGDKVFGENPKTYIRIFDTTNTDISEESDHQMVYAIFDTNTIPS